MEVSLEKNDRSAEKANSLSTISHVIQNAIIWVNWFFTMTKVERFNAGIDTSGEGREDASFYE